MSGLPKARSTTSSFARRSCTFRASICANAYGGSALIRRNSMTFHGTSQYVRHSLAFATVPTPKAVLLDVGGVLLLPEHERMLGALVRAGFTPSDEVLDNAHYAGAARLD